MGNTADLAMVQKTSIDTPHKEGKSQRVITERGAVQGVLYQSILNVQVDWNWTDFAAVGTNYWFVWPEGELPPRLSLVSPKVFSPFCHRWSFGSLPLSPPAFLVLDTLISSKIIDLIAQILFKLN